MTDAEKEIKLLLRIGVPCRDDIEEIIRTGIDRSLKRNATPIEIIVPESWRYWPESVALQFNGCGHPIPVRARGRTFEIIEDVPF